MSHKRKAIYRTWYCEWCNRPFKRARCTAKFCSDRCRKASSRAGQKDKPKAVTTVTLKQLDLLAAQYGFASGD